MTAAEDLGIEGLDQIEVLDGEGSPVFRAHHAAYGRDVVVKILDPYQEPLVPRRFDLRRKPVAKFAEERSVVTVHEVGTTPRGQQYLVMPYFPLGSLADQIKHGPLPWRQATELMHAVATTVAKAHDLGLVLGDLRPASVLLSDATSPSIAVYGMATRRFDDGRPSYAAPEVKPGDPASPAADVFSLSIILASLLVGDHPVRGRPPSSVLDRIDTDVPSWLLDALRLGLHRSPSSRQVGAGALASELKAGLERAGSARQGSEAEMDLDELLADLEGHDGPLRGVDVDPPTDTGPADPFDLEALLELPTDARDASSPLGFTPTPIDELLDLEDVLGTGVDERELDTLERNDDADTLDGPDAAREPDEADVLAATDATSDDDRVHGGRAPIGEKPLWPSDPVPPQLDDTFVLDRPLLQPEELTPAQDQPPTPGDQPTPAGQPAGSPPAAQTTSDANEAPSESGAQPPGSEPGFPPRQWRKTSAEEVPLPPSRLADRSESQTDSAPHPPSVQPPSAQPDFRQDDDPFRTRSPGTQIVGGLGRSNGSAPPTSIWDLPSESDAAGPRDPNLDPAASRQADETTLFGRDHSRTGSAGPEHGRPRVQAGPQSMAGDDELLGVGRPRQLDGPATYQNFERRREATQAGGVRRAVDGIAAFWIDRRPGFTGFLAFLAFAAIAVTVGAVAIRDLRPSAPTTATDGPPDPTASITIEASEGDDDLLPLQPTAVAPTLPEPASTHVTRAGRGTARRLTTTVATTLPPSTTTIAGPATDSATTATGGETTAGTEPDPTTSPTTGEPASSTSEAAGGDEGALAPLGPSIRAASPPAPEGPTEPAVLIRNASVSRVGQTSARVSFDSPQCVTALFTYGPPGGSTRQVSSGATCANEHALLLGTVTPALTSGTEYTVVIIASNGSTAAREVLGFTTTG